MSLSLCWIKPNLPVGDLQLLDRGHSSGVLRLTQAEYRVNGTTIDQTSYFRHDVFGDLNWHHINKKEMSKASFELQIDGILKGIFTLDISHDPKWESQQGNYTTGLHWGNATHLIQHENLIGKKLTLYKAENERFDFLITIE